MVYGKEDGDNAEDKHHERHVEHDVNARCEIVLEEYTVKKMIIKSHFSEL